MNQSSIADMKELRKRIDTVGELLRRQYADIQYVALGADRCDVVLGFIARQYQTWASVACSPLLWKASVAPFLLRGLVDSLITMSWILDNPESAVAFKEYSSGRSKLLAAHMRSVAAENPTSHQNLIDDAEFLEKLADSEVWNEASKVYLSNAGWTGKDIRAMADESGLKDLYDLRYGPLSADAHGDWLTMRRRFMVECTEPTHRPHWLPIFKREPGVYLEIAHQATDYLWMAVQISCEGLGLAYNQDVWDEQERLMHEALAWFDSSGRDAEATEDG